MLMIGDGSLWCTEMTYVESKYLLTHTDFYRCDVLLGKIVVIRRESTLVYFNHKTCHKQLNCSLMSVSEIILD